MWGKQATYLGWLRCPPLSTVPLPTSRLSSRISPSQPRHCQPPRCTTHKYRQHPVTCPLTRPNCHQILLNIARVCPPLRPFFAATTLLSAPALSSWTVLSQPPDRSPVPARAHPPPTARLSQSSPRGLHLCTSDSLLTTALQGSARTLPLPRTPTPRLCQMPY